MKDFFRLAIVTMSTLVVCCKASTLKDESVREAQEARKGHVPSQIEKQSAKIAPKFELASIDDLAQNAKELFHNFVMARKDKDCPLHVLDRVAETVRNTPLPDVVAVLRHQDFHEVAAAVQEQQKATAQPNEGLGLTDSPGPGQTAGIVFTVALGIGTVVAFTKFLVDRRKLAAEKQALAVAEQGLKQATPATPEKIQADTALRTEYEGSVKSALAKSETGKLWEEYKAIASLEALKNKGVLVVDSGEDARVTEIRDTASVTKFNEHVRALNEHNARMNFAQRYKEIELNKPLKSVRTELEYGVQNERSRIKDRIFKEFATRGLTTRDAITRLQDYEAYARAKPITVATELVTTTTKRVETTRSARNTARGLTVLAAVLAIPTVVAATGVMGLSERDPKGVCDASVEQLQTSLSILEGRLFDLRLDEGIELP